MYVIEVIKIYLGKSLNFHAILCILTSKMEALKKFEFSRQNCVCMSIFKQTHAMNTFVARFARSYLILPFQLFWLYYVLAYSKETVLTFV